MKVNHVNPSCLPNNPPERQDLQIDSVVSRKMSEKEFLTPPKRVTRFPRLEEGNVPINTSWFGLFLGISRVLGESWTARRYPSADSRPIRKADCVSKKNPLQNTETYYLRTLAPLFCTTLDHSNTLRL
ncbi:hypothetical protein TNCV_795611 [Trichonephila clavipes]|nr:hypothetical protein TNCV_795611 [Trichonephila clavipes]